MLPLRCVQYTKIMKKGRPDRGARSTIARMTAPRTRDSLQSDAPPWPLPRALLATLSLLAALALGALLALTLGNGAPWAALAGWSAGAVLTGLALRARFRRERAALPLGPGGTPSLLALLTGFGAALLFDTLVLAPGGSSAPTPELTALAGRVQTPAPWLLAALFLLLLQPLVEGLVFRGLLQPALQARSSKRTGLLTGALAWALFHLLAYAGAPDGLGTLFATRLAGGLLLGLLRLRNDSARASIFAHAGLNLFALLRLLTLGL